jgi:NADH-quinone oxidoreductase subunit E
MINWEFFDQQSPASATAIVDAILDGKDVAPTRGPKKVSTFKEVSRVLAGFPDGHVNEGVGAGPATLQGTLIARREGWTAPAGDSEEPLDTGAGTTSDQQSAQKG